MVMVVKIRLLVGLEDCSWNGVGRKMDGNKKAIAQIAWPDNEWQELKQDDDETTARRNKRESESEEEEEKREEEPVPGTKPGGTPCWARASSCTNHRPDTGPARGREAANVPWEWSSRGCGWVGRAGRPHRASSP